MDLWQFRGECGNHDPEIFFPFPGDREANNRAVAICFTCPVRSQCREHALAAPELSGVWGGMTELERDVTATARRRAHNYVPPGQVEHGTAAGYTWHRRYDPPACSDCAAAELQRGRDRRAAQRQEKASA
jgi:WhiB family transcriptional regulator, redox-sensing transcriptional regulator